MQTIIQDNFLVIKFAGNDSSFYMNPTKVVGFMDEKFIHQKDKIRKKMKRYGFSSIKGENPDKTVTLLLSGNKPNIVKFSIETDQKYYVSLNSIIAFGDGLSITQKNRHFYSRNKNDGLVLLEGSGDVFIENNSIKILQLNISQQNNSFDSDYILLFDADLFFKIKKNSNAKNTVQFSGNGKILFGK